MAIVSDIQFEDNSVKPGALDTTCSFVAAGLTASTAIGVGAASIAMSGLFSAKSTNNIEAWYQTTNTNGDVSIFLNNDANPHWEMGLSGNAADSFLISNCRGGDDGACQRNTFSITPVGAVGIGKTEASSVLDIAYDNSATGGVIITDSTNSVSTKILSQLGKSSIGTTTDHPLEFITNNATVATLTTAGRLGIGTDSPGASLDVRGGAVFNEDHAAVDFRIEGDTEANLFIVDGSADRVGIGTASPGTILNVVKDQNAATTLLINNNTAGTGAVAALQFGTDAAGGNLRLFSSSWTTSNYNIADAFVLESFSTASGGLQLATQGTREMGFWTDSNRRMTITGAGDIGIGTATPSTILSIQENQNSDTSLTITNTTAGTGAAAKIQVGSDAAGGTFGSYSSSYSSSNHKIADALVVESFSTSSGGLQLATASSHEIGLWTNSARRMTITSGGAVGVGTTTIPGKMKITGDFCVEGTINAATITGGGASLWSSGTNIVYVNGSCVGIGTSVPGSNRILKVQNDQNDSTVLEVKNATSDTAAASILQISSDASTGALAAYSPSYTTSNQKIADAVLLEAGSTASGGLHLATATTAELALWTNDTRRVTITSAGCVGIGTATTSDVIFKVQGDGCATGTFYAQSFSGGGVSDNVWIMNGADAYFKELDEGENIGVGTTTPSQTITACGNILACCGTGTATAAGCIEAQKLIKAAALCVTGAYGFNTSDGATGQVICTDGDGALKWGAGGYWTCISGPELYYTSGNVGIGTANPAGDLHVSAAGTPCIIIEQSGGSDEDKVLFMMKHQSSCASFTSTSMATPDTGTGRLCGTITGCSAATYEWLQVKGQLTGAQIDFSGCRMGVSSTCACFSGDYLNINGNVGIGTDTASHKLDIDGATHISGDVIIDGGSFTFNESGNSKDFRIEGDNESNLFIGDASTDRVGVGLADPLRRLHVLSSNTVARITNTDGLDYLTYNVMEVDRQDNTAGSGAGIKFNLGNSSSATTSTNYGYIGGVICDNTVGSQCGAVVIGAICDNVQLCTVNITYAGRVGIGTASPSAPLEVIVSSGNGVRISDPSGSVDASESWLGFYGSTDGNTQLGYVGVASTANSQFRIVNTQNDDMWFGTNNTQRVTISAAGNVGIGTATPSHTLDVEGEINALSQICAPGFCTTAAGVVSAGVVCTTGHICATGNICGKASVCADTHVVANGDVCALTKVVGAIVCSENQLCAETNVVAGGNICSIGIICSTGNICGKAMICADGVICSATCVVASGCIVAGICFNGPRVCGSACVASPTICGANGVFGTDVTASQDIKATRCIYGQNRVVTLGYYCQAAVAASGSKNCFTGCTVMNYAEVTQDPSASTDVANKNYVDTEVAAAGKGILAVCCRTSNGESCFTIPSGVTRITVTATAHGGQGGTGGNGCGGGGGGAGASVSDWVLPLTSPAGCNLKFHAMSHAAVCIANGAALLFLKCGQDGGAGGSSGSKHGGASAGGGHGGSGGYSSANPSAQMGGNNTNGMGGGYGGCNTGGGGGGGSALGNGGNGSYNGTGEGGGYGAGGGGGGNTNPAQGGGAGGDALIIFTLWQ